MHLQKLSVLCSVLGNSLTCSSFDRSTDSSIHARTKRALMRGAQIRPNHYVRLSARIKYSNSRVVCVLYFKQGLTCLVAFLSCFLPAFFPYCSACGSQERSTRSWSRKAISIVESQVHRLPLADLLVIPRRIITWFLWTALYPSQIGITDVKFTV